MNYQILFFLFSLLTLVQGIQAISCGDTISTSSQLNKSLSCTTSGITITSGEFNCDGHSISGNGEGIGISIPGESNIKISNCEVSNFSKGIEIDKGSRTVGLGWGGSRTYTIYSSDTQISNSTFTNNEYGIFAYESYSTTVKNSFFINNSQGATYFNYAQALVYNNTFKNSSITYRTTKGLSFCDDEGIGNRYVNSTGPTCSCMTLSKTQIINSDITLCSQKYPLPTPLEVFSNTHLNCNSATLYGKGLGTGIILEGTKNAIIDSCSITNFSNGVKSTIRWSSLGNAILGDKNKIINSTISKVKNGVVMQSYGGLSRIKRIVNSTILAENYLILNQGPGTIYAQHNYFGGLSYDEVLSKIKHPEEVILQPFLKKYQKILLSASNNNESLLFTTPFLQPLTKDTIKIYTSEDSKIMLSNNKFSFDKLRDDFTTSILTLNSTLKNPRIFIENSTYNFELYRGNSKILDNKQKNFEKITIPILSLNITYDILFFAPNLTRIKNKTIILSSGLWGSFTTWEKFAKKLRDKGYFVYVLALTGESQECEACLNYNYEQLVSKIFPKILSKISTHTPVSTLYYVGHSNGGKVAYDYSKTYFENSISKMILLGTPGSFSTPTVFKTSMRVFNSSLLHTLEDKSHVSFFDLLKSSFNYLPNIELLLNFFGQSKTLISKNLYLNYHNLIIDDEIDFLFAPDMDLQNNVKSKTKIVFLGGDIPLLGDGVISNRDSKELFDDSKNYFNSTQYYSLPIFHQHMNSHPRVLSFIEKEISK